MHAIIKPSTVADCGTIFGGCVIAYLQLHEADITFALHLALGVVGIISGGAAAYYHIKAGRKL